MKEDKKTLYSKIVQDLIENIEKGEMVKGQKLPTEKELMEYYNVSRITAKRALEELKNMGLIYRKKGHGSFLNENASKQEIYKQKFISMILPYENSSGRFIDYIKGASDYLYSKGYFLSVNCTDGDEFKEKEYITKMSSAGAKGIIYYPAKNMNNFDILYLLYTKKYPIVTIDKYFDSLPISYAVSDNFGGGYELCKYLIELCHKKIAFISSIDISSASSVRERFLGYVKALKDSNINIDDNVVINGYLKHENYDLIKICKKLYDCGVTAIICENDFIALDILKSLNVQGINVPNDISLAGFDNVPVLQQMDIELTTIEQDFYEIGKKAAELVIEYIEREGGIQKKAVIPVKLIKRKSIKNILKG
ncbi:transcriptional regulator, GntR family [Caloramator quimbayensis]|uniref:Transcriptional regulator, GntR family n=1 Tax=Caloramator quimbayensis TaxID=1147123 RepID=A0A1T4WGV9_9CLOT|nr:substrate-binding domain-containing protein [Caloramator quimbayensis]SKA76145.1 transcriptional regulator, GntR family [Caloramator quimbayensis]